MKDKFNPNNIVLDIFDKLDLSMDDVISMLYFDVNNDNYIDDYFDRQHYTRLAVKLMLKDRFNFDNKELRNAIIMEKSRRIREFH